MFRILPLLFLTTTAFDSTLLEKDDQCGSDGSKCALHALQRSARTKDTETLSKSERSKLRAYARQLQPGIVHVWKKLKILDIRSNYAADQIEVDLGVAKDDGTDGAPETAKDDDDDEIKKEDVDLVEMESEEEDGEEHHPHLSENAKSQARIRATVKEHAWLQKELDMEWKMLQQTSKKDKATRKLMATNGLEDPNRRHNMQEKPLEYEQCAGKGYKGAAECADGAICLKKSEYYSVCQPAQDILTSQGFKDPDAEAALLQRDQGTMADKFMNDVMQMHLQLEKLRQQVEDLNEDLGFIEQKAGRATHELMPCSGTGTAPEQCYAGKMLLEHIHVISNSSHANVSAEGSHALSCNNVALSFSENLGTVKCQKGHYLSLSAALEYCPDQQMMLLSVVLPKRKEKIKTILKPTTCGVNL